MKKVIVFVTVAFVVTWWALRTTTGVEFTLNNVGSETIRSVTVEVTGRAYALGDVPPGASKTVKVNPIAESDIKLRFPDGPGLTVDCYLEHDYGGSIEANVTSRTVVAVKDNIRLHSWF